MATFYGLQTAQANEKLTLESSLNLTLMQHPCDEEPKPQKVRTRFEVDPLRAWYYCISPNFHTLVILLQVDPTSGDEFKIVYEGCYKIENTFIFAWFSIPGIGHYHWLHGSIHRLPHNTKVDYLVHTIRHILNFLQL